MRGSRTPLTTYRLQFHRGFRLEAAKRLLPYLHELGVTDLYSSPLTAARRGSDHGYDVIDPNKFNPEVGSDRSFGALFTALRRRGMGLLLDIVPNHMAASPENHRWAGVLAQGPRSPYAEFFDIDWGASPPGPGGRVVLPVLGRPYRKSVEGGDLCIALRQGELHLTCGNLRLPLDIRTWRVIIVPALERTMCRRGRPAPLRPLLLALDRIDRGSTPRRSRRDSLAWWSAREIEIRGALAAACDAHPEFQRTLKEEIERINGGKSGRPDRRILLQVLAMQNYRLIHWRDAGKLVSYRRFFNISDLVCLRMEDLNVFEEWHGLIRRLVRSGRIQGLRIDHIDGLRDPGQYLRRLSKACGRPVYTVVEKILCGDERLPSRWPIAGTTGYDFLNILNGLFVEPHGAMVLRRIYTRFTGDRRRFEDLVYRSKRRLLASDFRGQMAVLGDLLVEGSGSRRRAQVLTERQLRLALEVTTACVPVYRTYIDDRGPAASDRAIVRAALSEARRRSPRLPAAAFAAIGSALLPRRGPARATRSAGLQRDLIMRWQQLTGPLMAKGHEDTALYMDHHLTSLNEVGGSPDSPGLSVAGFHRQMLERRRRAPLTMNATSTHDTKRGEDVRARINVLSDIPAEWEERLREWHRWNRKARTSRRGTTAPTRAEEVLIYQTMLGAWPADRPELRGFGSRLKEYLIKAAREAKERTSWNDPDTAHESALRRFVDVILDPVASKRFLAGFHHLQTKVARAGALNSLAQIVIKATAPGVPDFYQGSELWDLSLVDPDNRRPVDFARRRALLMQIRKTAARDLGALLRGLLADPLDGRIKLYTTWQALRIRRRHADLFLHGLYAPIEVSGPERDRVCAFARRQSKTWAVTVAPRFHPSQSVRGGSLLGEAAWKGGAVRVPASAPRTWRNALTGEALRTLRRGSRSVIMLAEVLKSYPVAILTGRSSPSRRCRRTA